MKKGRFWAALAVAVLATAGLSCNHSSSSPSVDTSTYHLVCANCNHVWTIDRDKASSYPADPNGAGFKCEKCQKFAARVGTQCKKCKNWYVATSRGMPCPHCQKGNTNPETPAAPG